MSEFIIKFIADYLLIIMAITGTIALLQIPNNEKFRAYVRLLLAGLTAYFMAKLIGHFYQPETLRPFEKLGEEAGATFLPNPGFPSDHVLLASALTLAVWFETKRKVISITLLVMTVLIGLGRILALVHTPLDVIGAMLIACAGIPWYLLLWKEKGASVSRKQNRAKSKNRVQ